MLDAKDTLKLGKTEVERLLSAWRAWEAQLRHDATYGTGDIYRAFRKSELDSVVVCIGQLQEVYDRIWPASQPGAGAGRGDTADS